MYTQSQKIKINVRNSMCVCAWYLKEKVSYLYTMKCYLNEGDDNKIIQFQIPNLSNCHGNEEHCTCWVKIETRYLITMRNK